MDGRASRGNSDASSDGRQQSDDIFAQEIVTIAKDAVPGIKTFSLPHGLQVEKGPDAVVEYIEQHLPGLLEA